MSLKFDIPELTDLMKNFYTLTGIRIVLFDENYHEIFAYPEECSPFCLCMRKNPKFYKMCCESDRIAFEACKKTNGLTMYNCHAGLIEVTSPIMNNGSVIGYVMFGQVSDSKDKDEFYNKLSELSAKYNTGEDITENIKKIKFKSKKQLVAASKILEACTSYILLKEIITPSRIELFSTIDEYVVSHLDENLSVPFLCNKFNISRTRLYSLCNQYIPGGIASYIKSKRLSKAKELLQTTKMSVSEISCAVGFDDYNYFLKSFKKHFGNSTKAVRKQHDRLKIDTTINFTKEVL